MGAIGVGLIRLLLALAVFVGHASSRHGTGLGWMNETGVHPIGPGETVEVFFVISGFYMALIWQTKYAALDAPRLSFYANRLLRLLPAYWLIAAVVAVLAGAPHATGWLSSLSVVFLIGQDLLFYVPRGPDILPVATSWSLGIELWFYLLVPFTLLRKTAVALAIVIATVWFKYQICEFEPGCYRAISLGSLSITGDFRYHFFPLELGFFMMGVLAYRFYAVLNLRVATVLGPLALALSFWFIAAFGEVHGLIGTYMISLRSSMLIVVTCGVIAISIPFVFAMTRNSKIDEFVGNLSYPVYLVHYPLLVACPWLGIWLFPITLALSIAINYFVERPIDRFRKRISEQRSPPLGRVVPA